MNDSGDLVQRIGNLIEVFLATRPEGPTLVRGEGSRLTANLDRANLLLEQIVQHHKNCPPALVSSPATPKDEESAELSFADLDEDEDEGGLGTLALLVQNNLLDRLHRLGLAREAGVEDPLLTAAESAWHETLKGLIGIESTMREEAGLPNLNRQRAFQEESLQVRRLFGELRLIVLGAGSPGSPAELRQRLEAVAMHIEAMASMAIYAHLRPQDSQQLEKQLARVRSWLGQGRDHDTGRRLWQDLAGFVKLLRQINLREELMQHDAQVLTQLGDLFAESGTSKGRLPKEIRQLLLRLSGRDERLDLLLERPLGFSQAELFEILPQLQPQKLSA